MPRADPARMAATLPTRTAARAPIAVAPGGPPVVDVVIPVHDEERDLVPSVRRLHRFLEGEFPLPARITIVDNASTDGSPEVAESLGGAGLHQLVVDLYKTWIAFNDANPLLHIACFNHSVASRQVGDIPGAIQALRQCLKLNPQFGPAHIILVAPWKSVAWSATPSSGGAAISRRAPI